MMNRFVYCTRTLIIVLLGTVAMVSSVNAQSTIFVAADSPYTTIQDALDVATNGDIIEVHAGTYLSETPLDITKSVSLIGIGQPVIDAEGEGTAVIISADDVLFSGFTIRNTGQNNNHEDSGIVIQADRVTVEDNRLEDVLFGIYFADANDGIARNNTILGYDLDLPRRGDGIRIWFSTNVRLENNHVSVTRDILIWFADDVTIIGNTFTDARYGLHFMYSNSAYIENNHFTYNSVGTYLMYSTDLTVIHNNLSYNRGPSGYGIALKDMDGVIVRDNWFVGNRVGLYLDNSPALYEGTNEFSSNAFVYNDVGVTAHPNVERNIFTKNTFLENIQQTSVRGRGNLQGNIWTEDGLGNYWSDYVGYDADDNQVGDMPYRAEKLFESLTDSTPELRFFIYSPAEQAINLAALAFPSLRPEPKLIDTAPITQLQLPNTDILEHRQASTSLLIPSLMLMLIACLPFVLLIRRPFNSQNNSRRGNIS